LADPRAASFELPEGVRMYAGFNGSETVLADRDWLANETILSGDIGVPGESTDNCSNVVRARLNAVLDGFIIQDGYSSGDGAGLRLDEYLPYPEPDDVIEVANCTIRNCSATYLGGGVYIVGVPVTMSNCLVVNNSAECGGGIAAMPCGYEEPLLNLTNLTVADNNAASEQDVHAGGGIFIPIATNVTVSNSVLWGNTHLKGGVYYDDDITCGTSAAVQLDYCDLGTGYDYIDVGHNLSAAPMFADAVSGDYSLRSAGGRYVVATSSWITDAETSPCIDAGDPAADYAAEPTSNGGRVNMGWLGNTAYASKSTGAVQVDIDPTEAVAAGAQWQLVVWDGQNWVPYDGQWHDESDTVSVAPGDYGVDFSIVAGYTRPSFIPITVVAGQMVTESGTYVATGSLQVFINGPSSARWKLSNSTTGYDSGDLVDGHSLLDIPVGDDYLISFKSVSGWSKPGDISLSIVSGVCGPYTRTYTPLSTDIHVSLSGNDTTGDGSAGSPYRTIGHAIGEADDGDVVRVLGSGVTFHEYGLSFLGKDITVKSDTRYGVTINSMAVTSVLTFNSGETRSAVLDGFNLVGGHAHLGYLTGGGGIRIDGASPTVKYCKIRLGHADHGGGIYVESGAPLITNCTIEDCEALAGGGVYMNPGSANALVQYCTIRDNEADGRTQPQVGKGGGVYIMNGGEIKSCTFSGNSATDTGTQTDAIYHKAGVSKFSGNNVPGGYSIVGGKLIGSKVSTASGATSIGY